MMAPSSLNTAPCIEKVAFLFTVVNTGGQETCASMHGALFTFLPFYLFIFQSYLFTLLPFYFSTNDGSQHRKGWPQKKWCCSP